MSDSDCPICLNEIDDSYTTNCHHTFCRNCILVCFEKLSNTCPLCRSQITYFDPSWSTMSTEEFYDMFKIARTSRKSQTLLVTEELLQLIKFVLTWDDKKYLEYLLSQDADFKTTYEEFFVKKKRNFLQIQDFYIDFALSFLFYSYH